MLDKITKRTGIGAITALVLSILMNSIYSTLDGHYTIFMTYGVNYSYKEFIQLVDRYILLKDILFSATFVFGMMFYVLTAITVISILSMLEEGAQ